MKKILIAMDHASFAQKIAETGYELAKAMKAQTILLHVTSALAYYSSFNYSPIMGFDNLSNPDVVEKDATIELEREALHFLHQSKQALGDETIQTIVEDGEFAETILRVSSELKVDMIVMGTHGRGGLEKMLLGSVAEKVLHRSSIPILIIPFKTV